MIDDQLLRDRMTIVSDIYKIYSISPSGGVKPYRVQAFLIAIAEDFHLLPYYIVHRNIKRIG